LKRTSYVLLILILPLMSLTTGCGLKPSGPPVGANLDPKVTANELAAMAGTWVYERQVTEGREVPIAEMETSTIVITGNSLVRNVNKAAGQSLPPIKSVISVDPTANPKQMDDDADVGLRISRRLGIYRLEADKLTHCYDNTGKQRPQSFDSPAGSSFVLAVLRRPSK